MPHVQHVTAIVRAHLMKHDKTLGTAFASRDRLEGDVSKCTRVEMHCTERRNTHMDSKPKANVRKKRQQGVEGSMLAGHNARAAQHCEWSNGTGACEQRHKGRASDAPPE